MRIQNNITAQNSHRQYGISHGHTAKNMEKLSSGYRVNRAADDAAGLAISEKMRTQIRGLSQAGRNVQDGTSLLQVADGAMQIVHTILQRMRELAVQSANGTNEDDIDREALNLEYKQLISELDQVADTTNFNGVYPLKGFAGTPVKNAAMTGTGIPPAQIGAMDYPVSNTPDSTLPAGVISGSNFTLLSPAGTYTIDSSVLNSSAPPNVTNFNLGPNVTLIINDNTGDIPGPLNFIGNGNARINGNVDGNVTVSTTNRVQVTGNISGTILNNGTMSIGGSGIPAISFSGTVINSSTGKMVIAHDDVNILGNSGDMRIAGDNSNVTDNDKNIRYEPFSPLSISLATIGTNDGRVEISKDSIVHSAGTNNGTIRVENGGEAAGSGTMNNGLIEVENGGQAYYTENSSSGKIVSEGYVWVLFNYGELQVGKWTDDVPPYEGSTEGDAEVVQNSGTIRNFSKALTVSTGAGVIDNYGTLVNAPAGAEIRHHARGLNLTISNDLGGEQLISYYVNGEPVTQKGMWQMAAGGNQLDFDPTDASSVVSGTLPANGSVYFTSWQSVNEKVKAVAGMDYSITDAQTFSWMSAGSKSGTGFTFFLADPLVIQSGANQGDETYLNFRALNAVNLGVDAEPKTEVGFSTVGDSDILTMDNASAALTITLQAINDVSIYRAELGAQYNRLEYKWDNLNITNENQSAAESRIRDADMAKEMTTFTKNNIINQSSTAMLAQANSLPQGVLQLLG